MPWSKLKMDEVAVRRTNLLKLRRAGVRYDDERIEALGYSSPNAARKDLIRALEANRAEEAAEVSVYRQEENERLDALLAAIWDQALEGDPRAIDTALKLMDRRAKLNGLDAPARTEVSGPDGGDVPLGGGSLTEFRQLLSMAGQPAPPPADASKETEGDRGDG